MSDAAGRRESQSGLDFKLHPVCPGAVLCLPKPRHWHWSKPPVRSAGACSMPQRACCLTAAAHPCLQLVLLTISDHHTRIKANAPAGQDAASSSTWPAAPARVLGYLLGQQNGRVVDISNSFELNYTTDATGALQIDAALLTTKLEQCEGQGCMQLESMRKYLLSSWGSMSGCRQLN